MVKEGKYWYLINGRYYRLGEDGFLKFDSEFEKLRLDIGEDLETFLRVRRPRTMTGKELREKIKTLKKLGMNPSSWLVELHTRYSSSLAPLIIVLVGLSLSLTFNLRSKSWGVILTFVLVVLYQGSGAWLSAMGKERLIDPVLSAWIPDMAFALVGLALFSILDTRFEYRLKEFVSRFFLLIILLLPTVSLSEGIDVVSDRTILSDRVATFTGNVVLEYEEIHMTASTVTAIFSEGGDLERVDAWNADLVEGDRRMRSEFLRFYPDSSLTYMYVVTGELETDMGKIEILAEKLVKAEDWAVLERNVRVEMKDLNVSGNFLKIEIRGGDVERISSAFPVVVKGKTKDGEYEILGSYFFVDPKTSTVRIGDFKGSFSYTEGKKRHLVYDSGLGMNADEEGIEIVSGGITTCSLRNPHYSISAVKIEYRYGAYIAAEHAVLTILGVPVFYFPYFFTTISEDVGFQMGFSFTPNSYVSNFVLTQKYSKTGKMELSRSIESEGGKTVEKYGFKLSDKIEGLSISLGQTFSLASGSFSNPNTNLSVKSPLPSNPTLTVKDNGKSQYYSVSGATKLSGGKLSYVLSKSHSSGKTSYLIPSLKLSKLSTTFLGGKLTVKSFTHKGSVSFESGTLFDHLGDLKSTGKIQMSYGKGLYKAFGTSLGISNTLSYSLEGSTPTSYLLNSSANLQILSKKFKIGFLELNPVQKLGFSLKLEKDSSPTLGFSENAVLKSSFKLDPISVSLNYTRYNPYSGSETLEPVESKRKHSISLSSTLDLKPAYTKIGVSGSYDFLKSESERLSNPVFTTDTNLNLKFLNLSLKTKTSYVYKENRLEKTDLEIGYSSNLKDWKLSGTVKSFYDYSEEKLGDISFKFSQSYFKGRFSNTISFVYRMDSSAPVSEIVDTFKTNKLDLYLLRNSKISGQFKLGIAENSVFLKYLRIKGGFSVGGSKNGLSLTYRKESGGSSLSLSYSLSSFDPSLKLSLKGYERSGSWSFKNVSFSIKKDLHCWFLEMSGSLGYDGGLTVNGLAFKFYIKEFPEKSFSYDLGKGIFNLNLF